jgi:formamidopyrimidine-DNA glycosylase
MPELPEVENELLNFQTYALGQTILRAVVYEPRLIKRPSPSAFAKSLRGRQMVDASRRGKYLIVTLDDGHALILHFGMGGGLTLYQGKECRPRFTRIDFVLASGWMMAFTCPRNICRVMLTKQSSDVPAIDVMGPEPLGSEFTFSYLKQQIERSPGRQIKALLMDQSRIAGIGNIYADEILYLAGVRPDRASSSLTEQEIKGIYRNTRLVLRRAIRTGGDPEFPPEFLVSRSGRGDGCTRCDTDIEKIKVGGRTSYFCPQCQR